MLQCAFYEKEITPPLGDDIPGYFTPRVSDDVLDRLYAKAFVAENDGTAIAMVALDATGFRKELCEIVCERVERMTGIPKENVMVSATHSHTSLPTGIAPIFRTDEPFLDVVCRLAADCVTLAYKRMVPAKLKFAKGYVDSISFVRNYRMKDGSIKTNPGRNNPDILEVYDQKDPEVPILVAYDEKDVPLGAVTNFACHLDCIAGSAYSGDYASVLSYEYKKAFGNDFVSLFIMGTAGNINHCDPFGERRTKDHYAKMGRILAAEALRVIAEGEFLPDPKVFSRKTELTLARRYPTEAELEEARHLADHKWEIMNGATDKSLANIYAGFLGERLLIHAMDTSREKTLPLQVIGIGDCVIYGMPNEVYVRFGRDLKAGSGTDKTFIATLANGAFGYVPTPDLFEEKTLYEVKVSAAPFGPDTGDKLVQTLLKLHHST